MKKILASALIVVCVLVSRVNAQPVPVNAALRYWMAFAVMKEPADGVSAAPELLDRIAAGTAAWDEAKLGKLLDDNREALEIMQRASKLPTCDWGLEYELGSRTPVAHLAKARVLGRLNGAAAARLAAGGQAAQAVDVWLAGVRFSQHVARDGTLISLLSARLFLSPALKSLARAATQPSLDAARRKDIADVIRRLPEAGFDWADAMRREADLVATARRLNPNVKGEMPSQAKVDQTAAEVRAERKAVLDTVTRP